jgi:hypothetical protein
MGSRQCEPFSLASSGSGLNTFRQHPFELEHPLLGVERHISQ